MPGNVIEPDPALAREFVESLTRGGQQLASGQVEEARGSLESAHSLAPRNQKAANLLGLAYFKLGELADAARVYETLVHDNPDDATLRVNLGLVLLKTRDRTRALREFEVAIELDPGYKKAHKYLGLALSQMGEHERAREHLLRAGSADALEKMSTAIGQPGPVETSAVEQGIPLAGSADTGHAPSDAGAEGPPFYDALAGAHMPAATTPPVNDAESTPMTSSGTLIDGFLARPSSPTAVTPSEEGVRPISPLEERLNATLAFEAAEAARLVGEDVARAHERLKTRSADEVLAETDGQAFASSAQSSTRSGQRQAPGSGRLLGGHAGINLVALASQRLSDLGATTWAPEPGGAIFQLGPEGLAVTVSGEMYVRIGGLTAILGRMDVAPALRRRRGSSTAEEFTPGPDQLQLVKGNGVLYLEANGARFHSVDLEDDRASLADASGVFLREGIVFAFEERISFENGRLTLDDEPPLELVHLIGAGKILLRLNASLRALSLPVGEPMLVPLFRLVGWYGSIMPRLVRVGTQVAVELVGEGSAILGAHAVP